METSAPIEVKKSFSAEQKQQLIREWKQSGQTRLAFAKDNGINYYTLVSWVSSKKKKSKISKEARPGSGFVQVAVADKGSTTFARISFTNHTLELFNPVSADYLKSLLKA